MPELTDAELAGFTSAFESLRDALARTLSETLSQAISLDTPHLSQQPIDRLMQAPSPVLQTVFTYSNVCSDEGILAFSQQAASLFADLLAGGDGTAPSLTLTDEQMSGLADAMHRLVAGLGMAIGNALNAAVEPTSCSTTLEALTLPPSFAVSGQAVQVEMSFRIGEALNSDLLLLFTPDFARAMTPHSDAKASPTDSGLYIADEEASVPADPPPFAGAFRPFGAPDSVAGGLPNGLDRIMDIPLEVTVELGRTQMLIRDVLELASGSIVELDSVAGAPVDLLVNGRLVAKGEVIVIDDNFGLRLTEIISQADRIHGLGKRVA